jgi:hypothetical protein
MERAQSYSLPPSKRAARALSSPFEKKELSALEKSSFSALKYFFRVDSKKF